MICIFSHPASSGLISSSASAPSQLLFVIFSVASKQKECCHVGEWKTTATSFKGAITQEFNCTSISISGSYKYEDGACPVQTNVGVALPAWISRVGVIDSWHSPVQIPRWSYYNCIHYSRVCILMHNTTREYAYYGHWRTMHSTRGVGVWIGNRRQQQIYLLGRESSPRSIAPRKRGLLPSSRVA